MTIYKCFFSFYCLFITPIFLQLTYYLGNKNLSKCVQLCSVSTEHGALPTNCVDTEATLHAVKKNTRTPKRMPFNSTSHLHEKSLKTYKISLEMFCRSEIDHMNVSYDPTIQHMGMY